MFPWQMWPKHNNCVELTKFFPHLFLSGMWVTWGMPLTKVWLWYLLKISFLKWGEYIFFKAILLLFNLFFGTNWALPSIWLIWDPKYYTFLESSWQNIQENHIIKMDAYIKVGKIFLLTCSDWDVPFSSHCVIGQLNSSFSFRPCLLDNANESDITNQDSYCEDYFPPWYTTQCYFLLFTAN